MKSELEKRIRGHLGGDAPLDDAGWKELFQDIRERLKSPDFAPSALETMLLEEEPDRPFEYLEAAQAERLVEHLFPVDGGLLPPRRGVIRQQLLKQAGELYGTKASASDGFVERLWAFLKLPAMLTVGAAAGFLVAVLLDGSPGSGRSGPDAIEVAQLFPGYGEDSLGMALEGKGPSEPAREPLKVSIWTDRADATYEAGDLLTIALKLSEAAHVVLLERGAEGTIRLSPFWGSGSGSKLSGGEVHLYPGAERLWTLGSPGVRDVVAVATTRPLDPALCDALHAVTGEGEALHRQVREKVWGWAKDSGSQAALHRVRIEVAAR